jgi:hypothetical protein
LPVTAAKHSRQEELVIFFAVDEAIGAAIHRTHYHVSDAKRGIVE